MRRAIYPGSFDPPTLGHLDIIERASKLFDELIVAIGINSEKAPFLSGEDRLESITESVQHLPHVKVELFTGLLVNFAADKQCNSLVRGLRAISDFDYEFRVALANRSMSSDLETIFLITREEYSFLASSVVREVATLGGPYQNFVNPIVAAKIANQLRRNQ